MIIICFCLCRVWIVSVCVEFGFFLFVPSLDCFCLCRVWIVSVCLRPLILFEVELKDDSINTLSLLSMYRGRTRGEGKDIQYLSGNSS